MPPTQQTASLAGSFRMFEVAGISVYLHWSWLVVAVIELQARTNVYSTQVWNIIEYVSLFVIVLLHEFGHALACRQVGGRANEIVLWPLGGIAFVRPPARPGAVLWSIAAGPLVNVVLVPVTVGAYVVAGFQGLHDSYPDADKFLFNVAFLNLFLLIFNMLPVYPLDGGQVLQALLWFAIGQAKSLMVVSVIGMVAGVGVIGLVITLAIKQTAQGSDLIWFGILAIFVATRSWAGFQQARILAVMARAPRHPDAACPNCHTHPLRGDFWACGRCGTRFDTFTHRAVCSGCGNVFAQTDCPECLTSHPIAEWFAAAQAPIDPEWRTERSHGEG